MIKSMTGFGKASLDNDKYAISVEVKSLNSKFLELNLRIPKQFSDKENEIRNLFSEKLVRGKVNVFVEFEKKGGNESPRNKINKTLLKAYYTQLKDAAISVGEPNYGLFNMALNMPEVITRIDTDENNNEDWQVFFETINEAINEVDKFRLDEAYKLTIALKSYSKLIADLLDEVETHEKSRKIAVIDKIKTQLEELHQKYDENRFEQELIYYFEKLDITEEKVRLKSHLEYFDSEISNDGSGKKLGFIAQEIGREINTIGSKANYAPIQHAVVKMKDELEKIKEQVLNLV